MDGWKRWMNRKDGWKRWMEGRKRWMDASLISQNQE